MMNKIIKALIIAFLSLLIIALTVTMVFFIKNGINESAFAPAELKLLDSYETELKETDKILLDLDSTDVEITESESDKIKVEFYSNTESEIKIENKDKALAVNESKTEIKPQRIFSYLIKKVVISVPAAYVGEYEITVNSGDISVENDLSKNAVAVTSRSGDVVLNEAGDLRVSTNSGDIKIKAIDKKVALDTSSGDVSLDSLNLTEASDITTSSGDVHIGKNDIKNNLNITTSSGDVTVRENSDSCYVDTDTSSGDVSVAKSDRKSDIVLFVKTSSGDITVS